MTNWIDLTNFAVASAGLMAVLFDIILALTAYYVERWSRRFFLVLFAFLGAYILSDLVSQIAFEMLGPGGAWLSRTAMLLESFFSSCLVPLLTVFLLRTSGEQWKGSLTFNVSVAIWAVYVVLLASTQFTGVFYEITDENIYRRGPLYPVLLVPVALLMLWNLLALLRRWKKVTRRERIALLVYLLVPLASVLLQMWFYGLLIIVMATTIATVFLFGVIQSEQIAAYFRQQQENERQRASIQLLQMRPHFIYNTLTSIYYLCRRDTGKAQQLILDFTSYLRRNFAAVAKDEPIPFSEELEHTRSYLAVEQVRFEGRLNVEFDTPHTQFRLPALTLQPIVENAVKHGIDPEAPPLHILVRTREDGDQSEITVEDNGPGYDAEDAREPHVALAGLQERLRLMCGATLEIEQRQEGGTKVIIHIPDPKLGGATNRPILPKKSS